MKHKLYEYFSPEIQSKRIDTKAQRDSGQECHQKFTMATIINLTRS